MCQSQQFDTWDAGCSHMEDQSTVCWRYHDSLSHGIQDSVTCRRTFLLTTLRCWSELLESAEVVVESSFELTRTSSAIDLFRLYILFSQYRSCDDPQEIWSFDLFIKKSTCKHEYVCTYSFLWTRRSKIVSGASAMIGEHLLCETVPKIAFVIYTC